MRNVYSRILIVWTMLLPYPAIAQTSDAEKEALALIVSELQYIEQLISNAELKRNKNAIYAFNYQALRSDFNGVINGVDDYLKRPSRTPVVVTPLTLQYREK